MFSILTAPFQLNGVPDMPRHSVAAIANEFLQKARDEGRALTHMQLQKLPYIAHGWASAILNDRLIDTTPEVWPYGPVYPSLYAQLRHYGMRSVDQFIEDDNGEIVTEEFTNDEKKLINMVWNKYKEKGGIDLSAITHEKNTPWTKTKNKFGLKHKIPHPLITQHYKELLEKNLQSQKK